VLKNAPAAMPFESLRQRRRSPSAWLRTWSRELQQTPAFEFFSSLLKLSPGEAARSSNGTIFGLFAV